jgi:hypothetical protein
MSQIKPKANKEIGGVAVIFLRMSDSSNFMKMNKLHMAPRHTPSAEIDFVVFSEKWPP